MNRILNDFADHKAKEEQTKVSQRLLFLEQENHRLNSQICQMKKLGGDKLVIKELNDKLNQTMAELKTKMTQQERKRKEE